MTKTMQKLLDRRDGQVCIAVSGARESAAARALVAAGLAIRYDNQSKLVSGKSYYNHFHRGWATAKPYSDIGGVLHFA
ncbi:hypothetical protein ACTHR6_24970 [Ralstonia holmesii]|uniref:hypothetical protein n=1 Tax=Ralstonia TaxID=48736 RepID=UPI00046AA406|nr:hypothetical protein [Ralstonia pickettii]